MFITKLYQTELPLNKYRKYIDVNKFAGFCKTCPGYGQNWSCPPFDFSAEEIWQSYESILLYGRKIILSDSLRENEYETSEINKVCDNLLAPVKRGILEDLLLLEAQFPGSRALAAGKCDGCSVCPRRDGISCVKPGYMRYSIEALGGDIVGSIGDLFDETVVWAEGGKLPEHFFLLGGLLKK